MHVDEAAVAEVVVAPHLLQKRFAAEHPTGVRREFDQQPELGLREVNRLATSRDRALLRDDLQIGEPHPSHAGVRRPGPSQHCADACGEFLGDERFGEVVVGTCLEAGTHGVGVGAGGDHDDRHVAQSADGAADIEPVDAGEHDVDEHDVAGLAGERRDRVLAVGGLRDLPALVLQRQLHRRADSFVVLDGQDSCTHTGQSFRSTPPRRDSRPGRRSQLIGPMGEEEVSERPYEVGAAMIWPAARSQSLSPCS